VQATRLAASFETLTGSVALTGPEKFPRKATCVPVFFPWKSPKVAGRQSVNSSSPCQNSQIARGFAWEYLRCGKEQWRWQGNQQLLVLGQNPGTNISTLAHKVLS